MYLLLFDRRMPALILTRGRLILRLVYVRMWEYLYLGACTYVLTCSRVIARSGEGLLVCTRVSISARSSCVGAHGLLRIGIYFGSVACVITSGASVRARCA